MKKWLITLALCLTVSGCMSKSNFQVLAQSDGSLHNVKSTQTLPDSWTKDYNDFATLLFKQSLKETENLFMSPASVYLALGMTVHGAAENTQKQLFDFLHHQDNLTSFLVQSREFQAQILNYKKTKISLSNSIWMRNEFEENVLTSFIETNREYFGAFIASLDFNNPNAAKTINDWVKKNTQGLIKKIVPDNIPESTVMYLINTIYFKADWEKPFKKSDTSKQPFYGITEKTVDMMHQTLWIPYVKTDDYQAILLPYQDQENSMLLILPTKNKEISFDQIDFSALMNQLQQHSTSIKLGLPKMNIAIEINLNQALFKAGVVDAFSPELANFTQMADNALEAQLHIASIVHKAVIKVDEKGTEAAAATSVEMGVTSAPIDDSIVLVFDRPYLLALMDQSYSIPLFMGRIVDPQP